MIDKTVASVASAVADIGDGATVLIGGFGTAGMPSELIDALGYRGDYSFEVFNDDYVQLPLATVAARARQSVRFLVGKVSRRSLPVRSKRAAAQ